MALGIYGLTQALLQIPLGMASDRWGRKPVILAGLAVFALGSALAIVLGFILAAMVEREKFGEGVFRTIFLYPLAVSLIVFALSFNGMPDFKGSLLALLERDNLGFVVAYGISNNPRAWYDSQDAWARIGYQPQDSAEAMRASSWASVRVS
mgnify:CR=1 FL=1